MQLYAFFILTTLVACKTTDPVVKVAKDRSKITLFSSNERGSALWRSADSSQITTTAQLIDKKLEKDPKNVSLLIDRARLYLIKKENKSARTLCQRALRLELHNKKASKLLSEIEIADGQLTKAEIILHRLGGEESKDAEVLNLMGLIALQRDQTDEAFRLFKRGISLDPEQAALHMNAGIIHLKYRQMEQAKKEFEAVLRTTPQHIDAQLHLAITDVFYSRHQVAKERYQSILKEDSRNAFALYNLALLEQSTKELDSALSLVTKALREDDFDPLQKKLALEFKNSLEAEIKQRDAELQKKNQQQNKERKSS